MVLVIAKAATVKKPSVPKNKTLPEIPKGSKQEIRFIGKRVDVNIGMRGLHRRRA